MGRCRCFLSQIVDGHADDDIRHCSGPIGSKRRQKKTIVAHFAPFWPFFQNEAAQLLPRFLQRVVRLPVPTT
tara:strand:- start:615 stop:830 length:216 start_codon:yes stop_codon:yes gene_type:complete